MVPTIEIFLCYAHEDEELRKGLEKQLRALKRQGLINTWHDRNISAGAEWEREIDKHLNTARIILLLVSPDFMDSDYCYGIEMRRAIERHEQGEACVIPVILRPVYWRGAPFGKLQALPKDAKPVTNRYWHNLDEAFFDIAEGILKAAKELLTEQWLSEANARYKANHYEEALATYERVVELDSDNANAYLGKGDVLYNLKRNQEALVAYQHAIQLNPNNAAAFRRKAFVLEQMQKLQKHILNLEVGYDSVPSIKLKQEPNGDSLFALHGTRKSIPEPFGLFVLADGKISVIGRQKIRRGHEASRLAIQTFIDYAHAMRNELYLSRDVALDRPSSLSWLLHLNGTSAA
jgi:tetratricopeptide (TPR) repeat protein